METTSHCHHHPAQTENACCDGKTSPAVNACCPQPETETAISSCCETPVGKDGRRRPDYFLWTTVLLIAPLYFHVALLADSIQFAPWYATLSTSIFELINTMWLSVFIGILMVGVLGKVPREFVISALGNHRGVNGVVRATLAGVLLDLCSHGILMVGSKLYERGASIGQVMAFLIASPWNSFSLTLILIALIGLPWTLAYIVLSMIIAVSVGLLFESFVNKKVLPGNPAKVDLPADFHFWRSAKQGIRDTNFDGRFFTGLIWSGIKDSKMVIRWIFFGVLLASLVRAFVSVEYFETFFGPSLLGLALTIVAATLIEVCSEGSTPIAADLLTRANAPGNGFAFLMTGVSTDYTEVVVMRDVTKSWKIALFLPLLTVPQVIAISWLINVMAT